MDRLDEALAAYKEALQQNPKSTEVSTKIKKLSQSIRNNKKAKDRARANEEKSLNFAVLKSELGQKLNGETLVENVHKFFKDLFETSVKDWCANGGKLDARVYFYREKESESSQEKVVIVAVDKAFESPDTLSSCLTFLRQHATDTSSIAACLVVPKQCISFPQVWKGQGSRKWKHSQLDGFFIQLELCAFRRLWFIPCAMENGQPVCRAPEQLEVDSHAVIGPLFR
ncbi:hypothetical protein KP509_21G050700 [Ceratopteris richardii]|nr:hypothetical protein KP509_21G050700 [Ceratopteris richardii]